MKMKIRDISIQMMLCSFLFICVISLLTNFPPLCQTLSGMMEIRGELWIVYHQRCHTEIACIGCYVSVYMCVCVRLQQVLAFWTWSLPLILWGWWHVHTWNQMHTCTQSALQPEQWISLICCFSVCPYMPAYTDVLACAIITPVDNLDTSPLS